jgi:hypothetical protein
VEDKIALMKPQFEGLKYGFVDSPQPHQLLVANIPWMISDDTLPQVCEEDVYVKLPSCARFLKDTVHLIREAPAGSVLREDFLHRLALILQVLAIVKRARFDNVHAGHCFYFASDHRAAVVANAVHEIFARFAFAYE